MTCVSSTDGIPAGFQDLQNVCDHGFVTTTNMTFNSAAPTITVGNGLGGISMIYDKLAANAITHYFRVGGVTRWTMNVAAAANFAIDRHNAAGVYQDTSYIDQATGGWTMPVSLWMAGAASFVKIGNATGTPVIEISQSGDEAGRIDITDGGGFVFALYFGTAVPAGAAPNGCFYFRGHNAGVGSAIYKRTGGAWVAIA